MKRADKTCNEVNLLAQDREGWRRIVRALCSTGSEEDYVSK